MSYFLPDLTIANLAPFQVTGLQDQLADLSWIEFQNESSYSLAVTAGGAQFQIPAWMGWPVELAAAPAFGLPISVQPKAILNYQATAPGNTLSAIVYRRGERPAQTAPYTLTRQTNVGNSIPVGNQASQVINTGNTAPTAVLSGTPTGGGSPEAVINNDGSAILGGGLLVISAAGIVTAIPAAAIPAAGIGAGYSASRLGNGTIPAGVVVPTAATLASLVTALDNGIAQLHSTVNARGIALGYLDGAGNYHQVLEVDPNGNIITIAPLTLATGIQETGGCGVDYTAAAANGAMGVVVPFRCRMTNVPTSIILTPTSQTNVKAGTPTATSITQDSFLFFVEAASAGTCAWIGTYTTVGN